MRRAEICCSQSDTSFYQSVFAEHVTKIRVGFFRSKHTGSDSIIDDYVLQMWETFQLSRGTHEVEHKHVDEIIEEDENIRGGDRHCKNCKKANPFLDFTDENSQSWTCKECEKNTFLILQMKTHTRDNHAEYWKFETSGGLFQINATNVRNRQFVEDILANTRGRSMCCAAGTMTHLRKVNLWWSDFT